MEKLTGKNFFDEVNKITDEYKKNMNKTIKGYVYNSQCIKCEYWFEKSEVDKKDMLCYNCQDEIKDKFMGLEKE